MIPFQPSNLTHDRNGRPFVGVRVAPPSTSLQARQDAYRQGWRSFVSGAKVPQDIIANATLLIYYTLGQIASEAWNEVRKDYAAFEASEDVMQAAGVR